MQENELMGEDESFKGSRKNGDTECDQQSCDGCIQYGGHVFCRTDRRSASGGGSQSDKSDFLFCLWRLPICLEWVEVPRHPLRWAKRMTNA